MENPGGGKYRWFFLFAPYPNRDCRGFSSSDRVANLCFVLVGSLVLLACTESEDSTPATQPLPQPSTASPSPVDPGIRFIAVGDTGNGSPEQYSVAEANAVKCASSGCDFGLLLGDVLYNTEVESASDPQFSTKFEQPYQNLNFPFYISLGNHHYDGDPTNGANYVAYSGLSSKLILSAESYSFNQGSVTFFVLSTQLSR